MTPQINDNESIKEWLERLEKEDPEYVKIAEFKAINILKNLPDYMKEKVTNE